MIKKLWVKFDGIDVVCVCNEQRRDCENKTGCSEYVVKFTPVDRTERNNLSFSPKKLYDARRKLTTELNKTTEHLKNISKRLK